MTQWVVHLDQPEAGDAAVVGGKAAQLHRLLVAGMPVPEACVVTVAAFRAHFPATSAVQTITAVQPMTTGTDPRRTPKVASPAVKAQYFHPELAEAVNQAVLQLFGADDVYLAVRSSAIGEDGAGSSFAGQHETYYHVRPSGLAEAIQACWASLWSRHALSYRRQRQAPGAEFAMAVIIQRMVQADRSGVCFTSDPTHQQPGQAWIEAIWGLGAALVDGRVTPDRLLMDRSGRVLRQQIGRKRHQVAASLRHRERDRLDPIPTYRQTQPVLNAREAADILAFSLAAERLFGAPQDVEWSFEGERFYVLQSRPITALEAPASGPLSPTPTARPASQRGPGPWVLFKPIAENFTEPLTPMTADLMRRMLPPGCRFFDGRLYLDLEKAARACPFRWTTEQLADALLLRGDIPPLTWNWRKLPLVAGAGIMAYLLEGISWHRTSRLTLASLAQYEWVCNRVRNGTDYDVLQGLHRLVFGRHPLEPMGRAAFYVNVSSGRYFVLLGALMKLLERYAPQFDRHQISQLCSGDGHTWSRQLVEDVRGLADVARQDPGLARDMLALDGSQLARTVALLPEEHPFAVAVNGFLDRFGHRCLREMELATPRWREDPAALLLMVRSYLRANVQPPEDPRIAFERAQESLRAALPRRWQQRLAGYLVERIRYYVSLRENTRHYHTMAMDVTRGKLLDLEQRLLAESRLRLPGDIFYLTWQEADGMSRGSLGWADVAADVRRRRRSRSEAARSGACDFHQPGQRPRGRSVAEANGALAVATAATVLTGHCASPGAAEGRVRVILDPSTAADLEPGDVLVAPYTDPAWTPLFPLASAVVVEVGSFLSHAGTVAREYRIPCLVDVSNCTSRLRDGQRVRVLASEGRIEVLES